MKQDEQIRKAFGKKLRKLREEKDWSQTDLGYEAEITPVYVSQMELGKVNPGLITIDRLAKALGCTPNDLMGYS